MQAFDGYFAKGDYLGYRHMWTVNTFFSSGCFFSYMFFPLIPIYSLFMLSQPTSAQCTKDIECKGTRICVNEACIEAPPSVPDTPHDSESCTKDIDCGGTKICLNYTCIDAPAKDADTESEDTDSESNEDSCTKDIDCQGEQICEGAMCVDPMANPVSVSYPSAIVNGEMGSSGMDNSAPLPATSPQIIIVEETPSADSQPPLPPAAAVPIQSQPVHVDNESQPTPGEVGQTPVETDFHGFSKVYASVAFSFGVGSYGLTTETDTLRAGSENVVYVKESMLPGFSLHLYGVPHFASHLGVYFTFNSGKGATYNRFVEDDEDVHTHIGAGLSMKFGGLPGEAVWLGFAVDTGFHMEKHKWDWENESTYFGVQVLPRFCIDVYVIRKAGFKLSIPISIGVDVTPFSKLKDPENENTEVTAWDLSPLLSVGVAFGG